MIDGRRPPDVAVIGLGVIGGSAALRLRERGTSLRAYTTSAADAAAAANAGIAVTTSVDEAVREVGLVLIAVPLDRVCAVAMQVITAAPDGATIFHAASLQRSEAIQLTPEAASRVLGTHPFAGSHGSGFGAARADLFHEATVFVEARTDARQRADAEYFWSLAGARRIEYLPASTHDDAMAWMSHLPQLASTALGAALAAAPNEMSSSGRIPLGSGARDATRLAMSTLEMWRPILDRAPGATVAALAALETTVGRLRTAVESRDWTAVERLWQSAAAWRSGTVQGGRE
jgi:prephenate dehydrogenase